jgi:predicted transcriptional regulator
MVAGAAGESEGLRRALRRLRWTQRELARRLGITESHLSRMLNGHCPIPRYVPACVELAESGRADAG